LPAIDGCVKIMFHFVLIEEGNYIMSATKPQMVRTGKINRHERIVQILLSGKPVSPDDIKLCLKGTKQEKVGYRLSTNIYNIRLDGGIVKVIKEGRKVKAYQLVNYTEFNAEGRYIGTQKPVATPAPVATETQETENV
jgi:hypothetical protein